MKAESFRRLSKEEVEPEHRNLIERIGFSINTFAQNVIAIFNKNITIKDNLYQELKSIDVEVTSAGIPKFTTQFKNGLFTKIEGIQVIQVLNLTSTSTYPTSGVLISFSEENSLVTIKHITGLQTGYKYRIKFVTIGG